MKDEKEQKTTDTSQLEQDPTAQFDTTREERQKTLDSLGEIVSDISKSGNINDVHTLKSISEALKEIYSFSKNIDQLAKGMLYDTYRIVRAVAQSEVDIFALKTRLKTIITGLDEKKIISEDELRKIHDEKILPAELPNNKEAKP